jgi:RHS repeat-associated protein
LIAFYHGDYLGSTNTVSDSAGEIISEYLYYPFGRTHNEHDTGAPGSTSHYQFTGHELDSGTDLYYYLNRFYDPTTAHFLNADPVWGHLSRLHGKRAFTLFGYPQRLNLYSYVINSPISRIDPNGLWDIGFGWKASYKKVCAGSKVDVTPIDLKISTEGASARASFELGQALFKKLSVKGEVEIGVGWSGDKEIYGTSEYALGPLQGAHKIAYNLGSKDWNYSPEASAQFDVFAQNQFPAPGIELMVSVPDPTKSGLDVDSILENLIDDVEYTADISLGGGFSVEVSFTGAEVKAGLRAMEEFAESNEYDMGGKSASQYDVNTTNTQSTARAVWPPE